MLVFIEGLLGGGVAADDAEDRETLRQKVVAADPEALAGFFIAQRGLRHFLMRVLGYSKCSQTCVINHSRFLWGSCKGSWGGAPRRRRSSCSLASESAATAYRMLAITAL